MNKHHSHCHGHVDAQLLQNKACITGIAVVHTLGRDAPSWLAWLVSVETKQQCLSSLRPGFEMEFRNGPEPHNSVVTASSTSTAAVRQLKMTFFSEVKIKFLTIAEGEDIPTENFLLSCSEIVPFFGKNKFRCFLYVCSGFNVCSSIL